MKLQIEKISLSINKNLILDKLDLNVYEHEIVSIIGPSASGKSSLLRIIAGFENINAGRVKLNGIIVDDRSKIVDPQKRKVGIIFQDLALFPHLNCKDNILFGVSKSSSIQKLERLSRLSDLLDISEILESFPHEISGGQQQRVAIARALAPKPEILLLDEPFSALDEELKGTLVSDVKKLLKEEQITTILITHNIKEAFELSDKIAFLDNKKIIQFDTPYNLYHKPKTKEIAHFCGIGSFINGFIVDKNHVSTNLGDLFGDTSSFSLGSKVTVMIRPDDIIHDDGSTQSAKVIEKSFHGSDFLYKLELNEGETIFCHTPSHHNHSINEVIGIKPKIDHLIIFN